jgi:hypothetical protein
LTEAGAADPLTVQVFDSVLSTVAVSPATGPALAVTVHIPADEYVSTPG